MADLTVKTVIIAWLRDHGYDGLCGDEQECACELDDLVPCSAGFADCRPAHKVPCGGECEYGGGCAWHMRPGART